MESSRPLEAPNSDHHSYGSRSEHCEIQCFYDNTCYQTCMHLTEIHAPGRAFAYAYQNIPGLSVKDLSTSPRRTRKETEAVTCHAARAGDTCTRINAAGVDSALLLYHCIAFTLVVFALGLRW